MRTLLAVAVAALLLPATGGTESLRHYKDRAGWSVSYPGSMHLERSGADLRVSVREVTIASFRPRTAVHEKVARDDSSFTVAQPRDAKGRFPADAVAFRMYLQEGGPFPRVDGAESRFPLRLSGFRPSTFYPHGKPRASEQTVTANGRTYTALTWIGPRATAARKRALQQVVASLAFPRLRPGAIVGTGGFTVMQPARHYRVGSFTRLRTQKQLVYLVRAPGGFYGIAGWHEDHVGGYKAGCVFRLDLRRKEFFCANRRARWDRLGRAIVRPPGSRVSDPLIATVAKVAWDGHVLLSPGYGMELSRERVRQLWPAWR